MPFHDGVITAQAERVSAPGGAEILGRFSEYSGPPAKLPSVLVVDEVDINRRLLRAMLKGSPYRVLEARGAGDALRLLAHEPPDLIVTELVMSEMSGLQFCEHLKARRETRLIPLLIVTSVQGIEHEIAALEAGADEFLVRPLHPTVVRSRVHALLRSKAVIDSLDEAESILFALAQSVEHRDRYTGSHCARLAAYSVALGKALGLGRSELIALYRGGYLHDIGKIAVRDAVLFKPGRLTAEEWVEVRAHTIRGEEICRPMRSLAPVLPIIRNHHEKWDGTGYPDGLKGEKIPLLARVLQVVDIYDALTTARAYKPALSHDEALGIMRQEADRGWRDRALIEIFAQISLCCAPGEAGDKAADPAGLSLPASLANLMRELTK